MKYAFACLDNGHYQEVNRTRIEANIWERDKLTSYYALNEIFTGEKHIGQTSSFCLKVDGVEMGRYRSSGLVISTGLS
jgi:NAD kinase